MIHIEAEDFGMTVAALDWLKDQASEAMQRTLSELIEALDFASTSGIGMGAEVGEREAALIIRATSAYATYWKDSLEQVISG